MTDTQQAEQSLPPTMVSTTSVDGIIGNAALAVSTSSSTSNQQQQLLQQMSKVRDANNKYKSLLKLAKERIQGQEEEIEALKVQLSSTNKLMQELESQKSDDMKRKFPSSNHEEDEFLASHHHLLRVCQRIRVDSSDDDDNDDDDDKDNDGDPNNYKHSKGTRNTDRMPSERGEENRNYTIWALLEYEYQPPEDAVITTTASNITTNAVMGQTKKRWKKWKKFMSESELADFIFRDTGEPIVLPHYSLTPEQSWNVENTAKATVAQITEEFRRYRVRAEVQRKQADATIKALQGATLYTVQQKIEGWHHQQQGSITTIMPSDTTTNTTTSSSSSAATTTTNATTSMIQWKKELKEQEAQWREAYDSLLQENNILKTAGGEALLASQWRHRFEAAEREKQEYAIKVEGMEQQLREISANNKYESKYRDLKESFRLYRKKAKEIFEAQQQQHPQHPEYLLTSPSGVGGGGGAFSIGDDAKIAYLRNLMVNYLSSDASMKDPMELAIKTVLQFTPDDIARIEKAKKANEAWF